jgi:hypothetical protein
MQCSSLLNVATMAQVLGVSPWVGHGEMLLLIQMLLCLCIQMLLWVCTQKLLRIQMMLLVHTLVCSRPYNFSVCITCQVDWYPSFLYFIFWHAPFWSHW